jgi:manganese transport protein
MAIISIHYALNHRGIVNGSTITIIVLAAIILALVVVIVRLWKQTRRTILGLDEVTEDVLKALYHLSRTRPMVQASDLVRATELQPDHLPVILLELKRRGWAQVDGDAIQILAAGEKRAVELIRAHRLWERYLAEKEGLSLGSLHAEATRREHLTTPAEADRIEAELGYPRFDPHGDPIPTPQGELLLPADEEKRQPGTPLSAWPEHRIGRIIHMEDEPPALFNQVILLGLTPGAQVEVDERTPGRVLVWSGNQRLALTPATAELVYIVDAPPESMPLSEVEIGFAARIAAFDPSIVQDKGWAAQGLQPGVEIAVIRPDPLGDPILYRINGAEIQLNRMQTNQIMIEVDSLHEIPLPHRHWLVEGWERVREIFKRYGSSQVFKRALLFFGPAFVVSVGYMDPGNWGTDIEGGARFGYQLLWVILMANLMAILLQILSAKLGIATGKSLPEICRDHYSPHLTIFLWATAELAAIATDLAEFLGGAVGFNLLFGIPLFPAAILTGIVISLILLAERYGFRYVELMIIGMIAIIGFVYMIEIWLSNPDWKAILNGLLVPNIPVGSILVIVGIIGATVMPHNLYLHSALIQTRVRPSSSLARKKEVYRLSIVDAVVALNGAFFVNAAILIMSAVAFSGGRLHVYSLETAHQTLTPILGPIAGTAFAIALLASGLSSSTTATMAGQVIMEGFLHHKMNVWLRRAITMVPSLIVIGLGVDPLRILVLSQVSLAFQLPFAMIPLVLFTSNPKIMGDFTNTRRTRFLAWSTATIILGLNIVLLVQIFRG